MEAVKIRVGIREAPVEENGYGFMHEKRGQKYIFKFGSWDEAKLAAEAVGVPIHDITTVVVLKPTPMEKNQVEITYS